MSECLQSPPWRVSTRETSSSLLSVSFLFSFSRLLNSLFPSHRVYHLPTPFLTLYPTSGSPPSKSSPTSITILLTLSNISPTRPPTSYRCLRDVRRIVLHRKWRVGNLDPTGTLTETSCFTSPHCNTLKTSTRNSLDFEEKTGRISRGRTISVFFRLMVLW